MDRSLQKQIAQMYPKRNKTKSQVEQTVNHQLNDRQQINRDNQFNSLQNNISSGGFNNTSLASGGLNNKKTPLQQIINSSDVKERFYTTRESTDKVSPRARKILIVIICTILAGFIFSSMCYTLSDNLANHLSLDLFDENGNPGIFIVVIHTLLFGLLMYLVLTGGGY